MIRVLIDTSAFIALLIDGEQHHQLAEDQYQIYRKHRVEFIITDYVYDELITRIRYDFGFEKMQQVMNLINKSLTNNDLTLFRTNQQVFQEAQQALIDFSDHKLSFTDATLYSWFHQAEISELFSLDNDFVEIGLKVRPLI